MPALEYKIVTQEPIVVVMPSDHRLAAREAVAIQDVAAETFLGMSKTAPALQVIVDEYLKRSGIEIHAKHEVDNLGMAISLVASTRGVTLLPAYARNFLPWSVTSRPLEGETPTIDLVIGYQKANRSPILKLFLSRIDDLIARVAHKTLGRGLLSRRLGGSTAPFSRANPLRPSCVRPRGLLRDLPCPHLAVPCLTLCAIRALRKSLAFPVTSSCRSSR